MYFITHIEIQNENLIFMQFWIVEFSTLPELLPFDWTEEMW